MLLAVVVTDVHRRARNLCGKYRFLQSYSFLELSSLLLPFPPCLPRVRSLLLQLCCVSNNIPADQQLSAIG